MNLGSNTESYPAFAHIGLRENPGKNLNQVTYPDRELNPGHLVSRPDALTVTPQKMIEILLPTIRIGCETMIIISIPFLAKMITVIASLDLVHNDPRKRSNSVQSSFNPKADAQLAHAHKMVQEPMLSLYWNTQGKAENWMNSQLGEGFESRTILSRMTFHFIREKKDPLLFRSRDELRVSLKEMENGALNYQSGERGGQAIGPPLPIHRSGNLRSKYLHNTECNLRLGMNCQECPLNVSFDGNDLRKEKRSGEFQCCEGHNSEMKHFRTHVVMNYFDCLHVGNTYLKLCPVFLKHPVDVQTGNGNENGNIAVLQLVPKQNINNAKLLRNNRHHRVRGAIACLLRNKGWEVHEEVHCISEDDSHRRADIIAINRQQQKAIIIDPTIRMERDINQAHQVDHEKRAIYEPCIPTLVPSITSLSSIGQ
ncbi:hypothetical protein ANN_18107 [Periplaneta americana]|uniref:Uncharacterized protein n=1 Tax=Periplaneta americana TaxID=6978 RepID=A0ABQ8SMT6_PERAM|nr:hypothetical protein ANN_18107 [Periplaneta americana]